jgi:hypothetical protein
MTMMTSRVATVLIGTLTSLCVLMGTAQAQLVSPELPPVVMPTLAGSEHLDSRAAAHASLRVTDLGDGFALLDLLGGVFPDAMRTLSRLRDSMGLYAFSRSEFQENGIDPDTRVLLSLGAAEIEDGRAKPSFMRHRFVVRTTDGEKFLRYMASIMAAREAAVATPVSNKGDPPPPKWFAAVKSLAKRAGVGLMARAKDGSVFTVRRLGEFAVVDYAEPRTAGPSKPKDVRAKKAAAPPVPDLTPVVQKMVALPKQTLAASWWQGTGRLLADPDASIALVLDPQGMAPLFARASCRKDWASGDAGLLQDAALLLRLHPFQWKLQVVWGLTAAGRARFAGAAADDGLIDARAATADGVATLALLVNALDVVRGAARTGPFAGKLSRALESMDQCGPLATVAAGARFWPQLLSLQLEEAIAPLKAGALLPAMRNLVAVMRQVPDVKRGWELGTVFFGSFASPALAGVQGALQQQSTGPPEKQAFGDRAPTFYDLPPATGFSEAGVESLPADRFGLALTPEPAGLGWYYRLPRRPAKLGPQSRLGYLHVNLARLLSTWADAADQATKGAIRLAASQLGQLGGNLTLEGDLLRLDLDLAGSQ